ncbi:hypothetical protein CBOM_02476 [Ceraceosorus bombacis]|uniref:Uncharacterized protein n=1 Tax=Ceraceosorus bombacis TaxID=401625 RepID=A0A0P1BGA5_9BASI|nr:hypothetical protein CBOM_02476 [Ceraceosorus bombacis]
MSYSAADMYSSGGGGGASRSSMRQSQYGQPTTAASGYARPQSGAMGRAHQANNANAQGWAQQDDSDDDESDDDWNVYDDFNNAGPPTKAAPSMLQRSNSDFDNYGGATQPYRDIEAAPGAPDLPPVDIAGVRGAGGNRQSRVQSTLLDPSAFGFDPRVSDPKRMSVMADNPMPSRPSGYDAYGPLYESEDTGSRAKMPSTPGDKAGSEGIELITVPALGAEYTDEERRQMRTRAKRKSKANAKKRKVQDEAGKWARGEKKYFGWLGPRAAVFLGFAFLVVLGVTLYFVIPRVPTFGLRTLEPVTAVPDAGGMSTGGPPANFSMTMNLNLQANNRGGWVTSQASDLEVIVTDLMTHEKVGQGKMASLGFKGRDKTQFAFPVQFSYSSLNATGDATYHNWQDACGPKYGGAKRPTLNIALTLTMNIAGLIGRKGSSTQLNSVVCPFELTNTQIH